MKNLISIGYQFDNSRVLTVAGTVEQVAVTARFLRYEMDECKALKAKGINRAVDSLVRAYL